MPLVLGLYAVTCEISAEAQGVSEIVAPSALPRPGYEPRNIRLGNTVISPELTVSETYDSNVFSLADDEEGDFVTTVSPRVRVETGPEKLRLRSEAFATHLEYLENPSESRTTYGASFGSQYLLDSANTLEATLGYDREAESRGDPESDLEAGDPIGMLHRFGATARYDYRRNRIGLGLSADVEAIDFDRSADSDRDLMETRFAARTSILLTPKFDMFVEGFTNMRDYDAPTDDSGVNRDAMSYGFLAGMGVDLTGQLVGEIGIGLFQTDYDDDGLNDFLGLGLRGDLLWSLSPRTLLAASVSREDVGTVLAGATTQIQTDFGLRLEQEVRHDLLITAGLNLSQSEYEGVSRDLTTVSGGITAEFFLNRVLSVTLSADYSTRFADLREDEYDRLLLTIGLRARF